MRGVSIIIVLLSCLVASAAGQSETGVKAYWTDYKPTQTNWDYHAASVFCAAADGDKPLEWRKKYGWTAYCGPNQGASACGKCLSVTNTGTGATETVRIVDTCGTGPLQLDLETAFRPIDTDGNGLALGHMVVNYEFVDCEPPVVPPPPPAGPHETNVTAYWEDFKPLETDWDLNAANVACAYQDGHKPLEWRSKYGWTAFCGKVGPQGLAACGLCLKVTNRGTQAEPAEKIVRIVDTCGSGPLELDLNTAFNPLDTDGSGYQIGHLMVDYEFVDCGDSIQKSTLRLYSE